MSSGQLGEALRRVSRAINVTPMDLGVALEAGLRSLGLRDAVEASRSVTSLLKLATMQVSQESSCLPAACCPQPATAHPEGAAPSRLPH